MEVRQRLFAKSHDEIDLAIQRWEEVLCPICEIAPKPFAEDYQGFKLCKCPKCGLQFLNPRPSLENLVDRVYTDDYFSREGDTSLANDAERHLYGRQFAVYDRLRGNVGKVLDVGCGRGNFLQVAVERGWEPYGCDVVLSPSVRQMNFRVWERTLTEADFGDLKFDLIRFNHVLEHTQNPLAELVRSKELLADDGIVHVSVPNVAGLAIRLKNAQSRLFLKAHRWRHYAAVHHLFFFTPATLTALVKAAGLEVVEWNTPVVKKTGQSEFVEFVYRNLLEKFRTASILDVYCRKAAV